MRLAEDIEAIKQLKAEYCYAFDEGRIDDVANLFTEDGVCEFGPNFGGTHVGRETIRNFFWRMPEADPANRGTVIHAATNPLIKVDGDSATGKWYFTVLNARAVEQPLRIIGRYDEEYRRVDGAWKIRRISIEFFHFNL